MIKLLIAVAGASLAWPILAMYFTRGKWDAWPHYLAGILVGLLAGWAAGSVSR